MPLQESRTYWFNPTTLEADAEFMLVGLVLGLAIYNGVLLDFPLPLALYKKILGQEVKLRDLEDMQPTLGRSLKQLLQYEGAWRRTHQPTSTNQTYASSVRRLSLFLGLTSADAIPGEDGSVEDVFCQTFSVDVSAFGETQTMPLCEGGADVPVTEDNRRDFVDLYVDYCLNRCASGQA